MNIYHQNPTVRCPAAPELSWK